MSEIWIAAVVTVGGGIISGMGQEKKDRADRKAQRELTKDSAKYEAILSQFERENEYFYAQQEKAEKMRGLAEFKKFNTVGAFAPGYTSSGSAVVVPTKPAIPNFDSASTSAPKVTIPTTIAAGAT